MNPEKDTKWKPKKDTGKARNENRNEHETREMKAENDTKVCGMEAEGDMKEREMRA